MNSKDTVRGALLGLATGDALGVPHEFMARGWFKTTPVTDMAAFGTHCQREGTWSDDASLAFCTAQTLLDGYDINAIAKNFVRWSHQNYWTARGSVFDIGITTSEAITQIVKGASPLHSGGMDERDNGNGSLMRILPLLFYIKDFPIEDRFEVTRQVSGITHAHVRSVIACFYYLEFALQILNGADVYAAYDECKTQVQKFLYSKGVNEKEIEKYDRLLKGDIYEMDGAAIASSGYVLHTLEAAMWCLLTTNNYKDAVLKAVNLGGDTDTTACVTGGLAGLLYGPNAIPQQWLDVLARRDDIIELADKLAEVSFGSA